MPERKRCREGPGRGVKGEKSLDILGPAFTLHRLHPYQYLRISRYVNDAVQLAMSNPTSDSMPQIMRRGPVG